MPKRIDLTGHTYGGWTVLRSAADSLKWACRCECGTEADVSRNNLRSGHSTSCGCRGAVTRKPCAHGMSQHPLYKIWDGMMTRCYAEGHEAFGDYGGRGIRVCDRWHDVGNFVEDIETQIGPRPDIAHTLDRMDGDGHYQPGNVRWATSEEQNRNRRDNVNLTIGGRTQCLSAWAKESGVREQTLRARLASGWTAEDAVRSPVKERNRYIDAFGERLKIMEWARRTGIPTQIIYQRMKRDGWSAERALGGAETQPATSVVGITHLSPGEH